MLVFHHLSRIPQRNLVHCKIRGVWKYIRRQPVAADGNVLNCIDCSINSAKAMSWLYGSSIVYHVHLKMCFILWKKLTRRAQALKVLLSPSILLHPAVA